MRVTRRLAHWLGVATGLLILEAMEPQSLEPNQRALVQEIQRDFEKALSSGDFTVLQRISA
jgi:hypothetical protein